MVSATTFYLYPPTYQEVFDAIHAACCANDIRPVRSLIPLLRILSEHIEDDLSSFLRGACCRCHCKMVTCLLSCGAIFTPGLPIISIRFFIRNLSPQNIIELYTLFIELNWDVNTNITIYGTALKKTSQLTILPFSLTPTAPSRQAVAKGNLSLTQFLISNGADVNADVYLDRSKSLHTFAEVPCMHPLDMQPTAPSQFSSCFFPPELA